MDNQKDSIGAIIGSIIVIIVLIIGGIYFGKKAASTYSPNTPKEEINIIYETINDDPMLKQIQNKESINIIDLESDIEGIDLNNIDSFDFQNM